MNAHDILLLARLRGAPAGSSRTSTLIPKSALSPWVQAELEATIEALERRMRLRGCDAPVREDVLALLGVREA